VDARDGSEAVSMRQLAVFTGTCTIQLFEDAAKVPCDPKVSFVNLANGRSWFTFTTTFKKETYSYTVSGGRDRQPNAENYYLSIDTFRIQIGKKEPAVDTHMEGECHTQHDKDAATFHDIECIVYDRSKGLFVTLHLESITDTKR
jgi:hypothetical protein